MRIQIPSGQTEGLIKVAMEYTLDGSNFRFRKRGDSCWDEWRVIMSADARRTSAARTR